VNDALETLRATNRRLLAEGQEPIVEQPTPEVALERKLKQRAEEGATWRRHTLGEWSGREATCTRCGMGAFIDPSPPANGIDIHGSAVALNCPIGERLEELRLALRAESISWGELVDLQGLADYIEPGDVELAEAAGIPEEEFAKR